jgi:ankyrin repeat protein
MTADQRLLAAARDGDVDGVRAALAAGAQVDVRDSDGRTALFHAVVVNRLEVAKELVAAGADPNALDDRHDSPFLETGVSGSVEMLHVLLPAAPDMRVVNRYGGVAVIPASERGHVDYVREIVKIGIDVNHVNRLGWTALLECVLLGDGSQPYQEIARVLLAAGANAVIGDKDGVTALQHARLRGYCEIVAILEEHGA